MWIYFYSAKSPISLQLQKGFSAFCQTICLDDQQILDQVSKQYAIKFVPALLTPGGKLIQGRALYSWIIDNMDQPSSESSSESSSSPVSQLPTSSAPSEDYQHKSLTATANIRARAEQFAKERDATPLFTT